MPFSCIKSYPLGVTNLWYNNPFGTQHNEIRNTSPSHRGIRSLPGSSILCKPGPNKIK